MERIKLVVNVTADDIKAGIARNCGKCPIALALIRALREAVPNLIETACVKVERMVAWLWEDSEPDSIGGLIYKGRFDLIVGKCTDGGTPKGFARFTYEFDKGCSVEPFTFTIEFDLPEWAVRKAA